MIARILKIELLILFLFTTISFFSFYYSDVLPDNFLSISSSSASAGFVSYYVTSFMALVGYYTGPWIFIPFMFFTLLYTFQLSRRDFYFDLVTVFTLSGAILLFCYLLIPSTLGRGVFQLLNFLSSVDLALLLLFFTILFFVGCFRKAFMSKVISVVFLFKKLPRVFLGAMSFLRGGLNPSSLKNQYQDLKKLVKPERKNGGMSIANYYGKNDKENVRSENSLGSPEKEISSFESQNISNKDEDQMEIGVSDSNLASRNLEKNTGPVKLLNNQINRSKENEYTNLISCLKSGKKHGQAKGPDSAYFDEIIELIEGKLAEFNIDGKIISVLKGPVVDTFELELGSGVKVSKVTGATEDLGLALYGAPIRIVYPMKGRTTVGIEVPRNPREIIYLDEVLNSDEYKQNENSLPIAMGRNAFGEITVVDLARMPHMLVAGATGSGKSVFINTLLVSLLAKKSPQQMKLILIDPKQLELALYAKLPHLVMPVITNAKIASIALLWACQEMERRYSILKEFGVRNIDGFNTKLKNATPEMLAKIHPFYEESGDENYELPYLVIIVDEFADLILTKAGKEIENNICRLAAKARAAGVHLVLATQRPSVDVITGLIKSNFPTRVSFRVTTSVDSRTILSAIGAEKLLGNGDMLYKHGVETTRIHSSYVDEEEIEALASKLLELGNEFHPGAMEFLENGGEESKDPYSFGSHISSGDSGGKDDLYDEAVRIVQESQMASASMIQRRLRVGYNRAANLVEEMESKGVIGPAQGSKPRKVLI